VSPTVATPLTEFTTTIVLAAGVLVLVTTVADTKPISLSVFFTPGVFAQETLGDITTML
jgi:hypothetical protein